MMLKRIFYIFLTVLGIAGVILSGIQFVVAIRFGEIGRVVLYLTTAIVCAELAVICTLKVRSINRES